MSLRNKQSEFVLAIAKLISYTYSLGYELTFGDTYPGKHEHQILGAHPKGLAIDLNLFKSGKFLTDTLDHQDLGDYWKSLGGIWGGDFSNPDGNHYEWPDRS